VNIIVSDPYLTCISPNPDCSKTEIRKFTVIDSNIAVTLADAVRINPDTSAAYTITGISQVIAIEKQMFDGNIAFVRAESKGIVQIALKQGNFTGPARPEIRSVGSQANVFASVIARGKIDRAIGGINTFLQGRTLIGAVGRHPKPLRQQCCPVEITYDSK